MLPSDTYIHTLNSPEHSCNWDRICTHQQLASLPDEIPSCSNHVHCSQNWTCMWKLKRILIHTTGCKRGIRKTFEVKIWKEPLLVREQTIPQQKALDLRFNFAPWKWAWYYHEAATPCPKITFFTPRPPMLFAVSRRASRRSSRRSSRRASRRASRCGALLRMPALK